VSEGVGQVLVVAGGLNYFAQFRVHLLEGSVLQFELVTQLLVLTLSLGKAVHISHLVLLLHHVLQLVYPSQ